MSAIPIANFLVEFASELPQPVASPMLAPVMSVVDELDWEAKLDEAYARGLVEGRQAVEAMADARIEEQRAEFEASLSAARAGWCEETSALSAKFADALQQYGQQVGDSVAQVLRPFLAEAVLMRAVSEICTTIADLAAANPGLTIEIAGPKDTFEAVRNGLPPVIAEALVYTPADSIELTVKAGTSLLETRIATWLEEVLVAAE
ncbi:hypothetical protein [Hyphomicrobium sp. D-2]|uniref:hypothetical protein n=1 Tax=Hyphomicrobium sp. D-2 TaxID=3041621 RepID=UPI002454A39A|nr:hypothetical protein [Hyphomicrobium sp. D-2]MDH4983660.1 hypothetical protein [Hyphomicrobium sp. D-2]